MCSVGIAGECITALAELCLGSEDTGLQLTPHQMDTCTALQMGLDTTSQIVTSPYYDPICTHYL